MSIFGEPMSSGFDWVRLGRLVLALPAVLLILIGVASLIAGEPYSWAMVAMAGFLMWIFYLLG